LLAALSTDESSSNMDAYHITTLIKFLQTKSDVNQEDLFSVEWAYIPLLDGHRGTVPQLLENRMATDPEFFCEVIRLIFRSDKEEPSAIESTEQSKAIARNAWRLLEKWEIPPGSQKNGTFSEDSFSEWLEKVKKIATESGHLEVALSKIGEVLIAAPSDPDGLWINRAIASALNDRDAENMREGYRLGTYNSRGAHWVDPTGKPEKELADQFRTKAEEVENAGYQRFAVTLRVLADGYDKEAERVISEQKNREDD